MELAKNYVLPPKHEEIVAESLFTLAFAMIILGGVTKTLVLNIERKRHKVIQGNMYPMTSAKIPLYVPTTFSQVHAIDNAYSFTPQALQ